MHHILLVEDDFSLAKNLKDLLEADGYQTTLATNLKAALDAITSESFDLVLADIALPDGSGYSICTAVKNQAETPVIFLTASDDEASVVTGLDLGADDYIVKP
ncbi:MAG: response regulator, partial [Coriobacteriia bacterium]|nr:response regulator [Coriobacteriia bacterium]